MKSERGDKFMLTAVNRCFEFVVNVIELRERSTGTAMEIFLSSDLGWLPNDRKLSVPRSKLPSWRLCSLQVHISPSPPGLSPLKSSLSPFSFFPFFFFHFFRVAPKRGGGRRSRTFASRGKLSNYRGIERREPRFFALRGEPTPKGP